MSRYELVIFDWDGTLMDSSARIVSCLQHAAQDLKLPVPSDNKARHIIGLNLQDSLSQLFGEVSQAVSKKYIERYRYHFYHPQAEQMKMFAGVMDGLKELDRFGLLLAVATGKGRQGLDPILKQYDLESFFVMTRCADEAYGKPNPKMLFDILEFTGQQVNQAVMVGDTSYDLEMAGNAGMHAIAVDYGMHDINHLHTYNPVASFSDFSQITDWLLNRS